MINVNADADGLSRRMDAGNTTAIFPDVLKVISIYMTLIQVPLSETIMSPDEDNTNKIDEEEIVPEEVLTGTALSAIDLRKAQLLDDNVRFLIDSLIEG